jgi:hypothetical protein
MIRGDDLRFARVIAVGFLRFFPRGTAHRD